MKYLLSTIADVDFEICGETEIITYKKNTSPAAEEYGIGLEIAEFCISENLDEKFDDVLPHFEYNRKTALYAVLHGPYNELMPHAVDNKVAQAAKERYDWTWELCKKYNLNKVVLHANYMPTLYFPEWFIARQIEFWKAFLKEHKENITICLENVLESDPGFFTQILEGVGDERLKMCLDIGHANLTPVKPMDWLRECSPYIAHYHIHNNDGPVPGDRPSLGDKHAALNCGIINMKEFLEKAEELTPNATAAVESYGFRESAQWLKDNGFI